MIYMIKCALFDLDGTLVDTSADLGRATAWVLERFGREPKWTDTDYRAFVGNGARLLLDRAFEHSLSDKELDEALELFKVRYNEILLDNATIYDGITEVLDYLKSKNVKLAVVTNKPHQSALLMVESLFGKNCFDFIIGAVEDKPKSRIRIQLILRLKDLAVKAVRQYFSVTVMWMFILLKISVLRQLPVPGASGALKTCLQQVRLL